MENLNLFIRSIFVDNMVFAYFLGMCSFLAVSKNVKTAFGLGVAVTFMLIVTLPINYLLEKFPEIFRNNGHFFKLRLPAIHDTTRGKLDSIVTIIPTYNHYNGEIAVPPGGNFGSFLLVLTGF